MGLTCEIAQSEDYTFVREQTLRPFGLVKVLKDNRLNKYVATKALHMRSQREAQEYCKLADLARQATSKLPTLLRINSHSQARKPNCMLFSVQLEFDYVSRNLAELLRQRSMALHDFIQRKRKTMDLHSIDKVRLNDYAKINVLSQEERGYINLHFLECEVLRLIDHVAGSVYYLRHFDVEHAGLRPENVLVDDQGKYLLVDRQLFKLDSNYEQGLRGKAGRTYMSPQEFKSLKEVKLHPSRKAELSEIFSIGLMALELAVLPESVSGIYDFDCWRASTFELNKLLARVSGKYSQGLTELLQRMLSFQQKDRINLEQLIDLLSPLLKSDLQLWDSVFEGDKVSISSSKSRPLPTPNLGENLLKRLSEIEAEYHRVMSSKVLNESTFIREESLKRDEQRIIEKLKRINHQRESNKWSEVNRESQTWGDASLVRSRQL